MFWRTRSGSIGAKHTAVARFRLQQRMTGWTLPEPHACIVGHGIAGLRATVRAVDCGLGRGLCHERESTAASAIGTGDALLTRSMPDSVPVMKAVFAALLLLFQLQPVLGTVACLGLPAQATKQECKMPEHGQPQTTSVATSGAAAQNCQLATICTPAPPAIPGLFITLETAVPLHEGAGTLAATLPRGISPAPPFHPPRA